MVYMFFSIQQSYVRIANFYSFHEQTLTLTHQHRQEDTLKEICMKGTSRSEVLLGSICSASLVDDVCAGEHDLEGNDDEDEHAHLGSCG